MSRAQRNNLRAAVANERSRLRKEKLAPVVIDELARRYSFHYRAAMITTKPGGMVRIQTKAYKDLKLQALAGKPVPMLADEPNPTASSSRGEMQIEDGAPIEPEATEVKTDEAPIEPEAIEVKTDEAQGKEVAQPCEASEARPKKKRSLLAVVPHFDLDAWKAARQEEGWEPEAVVSFRYNCGTRAGQVRRGTFVDFLTTSKRGPGMQLQEEVGFRTYIWSEMSDVSFEVAPEPAQTMAEEAFPGKCISCVKLVKALHNGRCARCSVCPHGVDLSFYSGCSACIRMSGFRSPKAAMEFQIAVEIWKEESEARRMAGEDVILVAMAREGRRMAMSDVNVTLAMEWYHMKANDLCAPAV